MKKTRCFLASFLVFQLVSMQAAAQATAIDKKVTLGDLIKKVKEESRNSKLSKIQKNSVVVPDTKVLFEEKKPVNLSSVKPPRLAEFYQYENRDKTEYEKTLNLQITELFKLTQKFKSSTNRGELWLRLAELYVEKSSLVDTRKQNEYDVKLQEFLAGKTQVKPALDQADAHEYNRKAIQLYDWFLKDFPVKSKEIFIFFLFNYE